MRILNKPEYFYQPRQLARRLYWELFKSTPAHRALVPWGAKIEINSRETIGRSILHFGVYDLSLSECLWRITNPGSHVADIGANIGYFSQLLSYCVKSSGRVSCFEPHPEMFARLSKNIESYANCEIYQLGLSEVTGQMDLHIPKYFSGNQGVSSLEPMDDSELVSVKVSTLDDVFASEPLDLIKIDVEGHEESVFEGGSTILNGVQNIFFEDFGGRNSRVISQLRKKGFTVYRIAKTFRGAQLISVKEGESLPKWEPPNYLATKEKDRVETLMRPKGWRCLAKFKR